MSEYFTDPNCFDSSNPSWGVLVRSYNLLKAAAAGNGPWVDVRAMSNFSVHLYGTFGGASVSLYASNDSDPNLSGDTGIVIGSSSTSAGMQTLTGPYRWIRAVVTGGTSPSINGVLHGAA
jgi:hypothetical protein